MDFTLDETATRLCDTARWFARERLAPAVRDLDGRADPADTHPASLIVEASELGLRTITLPTELGGQDADEVTQVAVLEELCAGDPGFGMALAHPWRELRMLLDHGTPLQHEYFLHGLVADHAAITSLALTEDHFGSDASSPDPLTVADGPRTVARHDGDDWIIDGRKVWITAGNVSKLLIVFARTDSTVPWRDGLSAFLVPRETPGLRVGVVEDKLGLRLNQNAEVILDGCVIPDEWLLGRRDRGAALLRSIGPGSKAKEAAKCLGIARAALDAAWEWTSTRVQGGRRLSEHQAIAVGLAELAMQLEAARSLTMRAAWACDHAVADADLYATMAKVQAARVSSAIALRALELHGSAGVRRGSAPERHLRDAATMLHATGGNDALLVRIHHELDRRRAASR